MSIDLNYSLRNLDDFMSSRNNGSNVDTEKICMTTNRTVTNINYAIGDLCFIVTLNSKFCQFIWHDNCSFVSSYIYSCIPSFTQLLSALRQQGKLLLGGKRHQ